MRRQVGGRDQLHNTPQFVRLAAPKMCAPACFYRHDARLQLTDERQHLKLIQLLA